MIRPLVLAGVYITLAVIPLLGWNARYRPEEATVAWPQPETADERSVDLTFQENLDGHPVLEGKVVEGDGGDQVPLIAMLDGEGFVLWSKRLPSGIATSGSELDLANGKSLFSIFQTTINETLMDIIGRFDPSEGFVQRFGKSLPALNPEMSLSGPNRSFEPQANGDLALVQVDANRVQVLMLDPDGEPRFARTFTMPESVDTLPFPIPINLSYAFAKVASLDNGDYFLTTNGLNLIDQTNSVFVLRLNDSGGIVWQAGVKIPGSSSISTPMPDERVVITGGLEGLSVASTIAVLSSEGGLEYARSVPGLLLSGVSFNHFRETGEFLFTGMVPSSQSQTAYLADGAIFTLSDAGELLHETAFDLGDIDHATHLGTDGNGLYFELVSLAPSEVSISNGLLVRLDANLENPLSRSYLEQVGPTARKSASISPEGGFILVSRDEDQDWIDVHELDTALQPAGDCALLLDREVGFYNPGILLESLALPVQTHEVTASDWPDAPDLVPYSFSLVDIPLIREGICGDPDGGGKPVTSLWQGVVPANEQGDKLAGIGCINDVAYPYVWHYAISGYLYILDDYSALDSIWGWNYEDGFWFWANDGWDGWYFNLLDPNWGLGGWDKWE